MVLPSSKWRMGWECVSIWTSTIRQPKWIVPAGKASAIASMRSLLLKQRNSPFLPWRKFATIDHVHALCYPYNFLHWSLVIYLWESLIIFLYTHTHIYIIWCLAQKLSPTCCRKVSTKIHTWWFWNPSESGRTGDFFFQVCGLSPSPFLHYTKQRLRDSATWEVHPKLSTNQVHSWFSNTYSRSLMRQINVLQKLLALPLEPKPDYILVYFCKDYLVCSL